MPELTRMQRLEFRAVRSLQGPTPSKQRLREELARDTEAFYRRGGVRQMLPQNYSALNYAEMDVEELHHLTAGQGPSPARQAQQ